MLKEGDKVVMQRCMEADTYEDVVWTCKTDEFIRKGSNQSPVIFLEDFSGSFSTEYLRKVDVTEETVSCIICEKVILQDLNGNMSDKSLYTYWCNKCMKTEEKRLKVLENIEEEMLITHTVFKNADLDKLPQRLRKETSEIVQKVGYIRRQQCKNDKPKYIVINTDEDPHMIGEVINILKKYNQWGKYTERI